MIISVENILTVIRIILLSCHIWSFEMYNLFKLTAPYICYPDFLLMPLNYDKLLLFCFTLKKEKRTQRNAIFHQTFYNLSAHASMPLTVCHFWKLFKEWFHYISVLLLLAFVILFLWKFFRCSISWFIENIHRIFSMSYDSNF